jgi:hypothetical protein
MVSFRTIVAALAVATVSTAPAFANHNNPWAGPDDILLSKKHDSKQEKSIGKPGQDEMRGNLRQEGAKTTGGPGRGSGGTGGKKGGGKKR